jgi:Ca-activated chloride channel family protein
VAYAGSAHEVLPLTDDTALLQTYLDALDTSIMPIHGRRTVAALDVVERTLEHEEAPGTVLLLTGGVEDAAFDRLRAAMEDGRHQPLVLGIGTAEGGPVRTGPQRYLTGSSGARVFARLDVAALRRLHDGTGVPVATITADDSDVKWIERRVQTHLQQRQTEANTRWRDEGWWLTIPLVILAALWFRRGWTMHWSAAAAILWMAAAPPAASAQTAPWLDPWLTADQQGRLAFERGDLATAASRFDDPMWKGTALYRAGKFAEALDAFARVDSPESDYNQGNCLAKLGQFPDAVARYQAALAKKPQYPQATRNLAIVRALIPPPKKDEKQEAGDPAEKPDQIQFDDQARNGKRGPTDIGQQTADVWMRNIQTTPAGLLRRKFEIEARGQKR